MKEDKLDFLIMYEITTRELESIILLGEELKKRGYSVEYFSFEWANLKKYIQNRRYIKKYHNKVEVVLMPSLYHDTEVYSLVYYVCGECRQIVNLRWEQSFTKKEEEDLDNYYYPHGDAKFAYHVCWGKATYNNLIKTNIEKSRLILSGPLHMDFLREEFQGYFMDKTTLFKHYNLPMDKKSILYISSFAISSMSDRQIESEEKNAGESLYSSFIHHQKQSREITLRWIEEVLREKDCTFIYRPHPVENVLEDLKDLEQRYENFHVIAEYSVKQWILISDCIVTWMSTSIAEAFFAKKACLVARPIPFSDENEVTIYQNAKITDNKKEFLENILDVKENSISEEVIKAYYDVTDIPSYIRLSNELEKIYKEKAISFPWNEQKIKKFSKKRLKYIFQSILVSVYIPCIDIIGKIRKKTGISFGKLINGRADGYQEAQRKKYTKLASQKLIQELSNKIQEFI